MIDSIVIADTLRDFLILACFLMLITAQASGEREDHGGGRGQSVRATRTSIFQTRHSVQRYGARCDVFNFCFPFEFDQLTLQTKKAMGEATKSVQEVSKTALEASKTAAGVSKNTLDDLTYVGKSTLGDLTKSAKEAAAKKGLLKVSVHLSQEKYAIAGSACRIIIEDPQNFNQNITV